MTEDAKGFCVFCHNKKKLETKIKPFGVPIMAEWLTNLASNHEAVGSIPGLAQWVKDAVLP